MPNTEMLLIVLTLLVVVLAAWVLVRLGVVLRHQAELVASQEKALGAQHQAMLKDLHQGLALQSDRTQSALTDTAERLRQALEALRLEQTQSLAAASDALKTGQ